MKKNKPKSKKSQSKVILLFVVMTLLLNIVVIGLASYVYTRDIKESYSRICSGVAQVVATSVDGNKVNEMFSGSAEEEYALLKNQLLNTAEQIPNLERVYIYNMQRDGMHLLIDSNDNEHAVGTKIKYPQNLEQYIDAFYEGKTPQVFESISDGEYLMTSLLPVFDLRGNCVCYVGCDIDMDEAYSNRIDFIRNLTIIMLIPTITIAVITAIYIKIRILSSINCLDDYLQIYYDPDED